MDAHSNFGSDFEFTDDEEEGDIVQESGEILSDDDEAATPLSWAWNKNVSFHPNVFPFDEPTGLTEEITAKVNSESSPFDILRYFVDGEMMDSNCKQFNTYAH